MRRLLRFTLALAPLACTAQQTLAHEPVSLAGSAGQAEVIPPPAGDSAGIYTAVPEPLIPQDANLPERQLEAGSPADSPGAAPPPAAAPAPAGTLQNSPGAAPPPAAPAGSPPNSPGAAPPPAAAPAPASEPADPGLALATGSFEFAAMELTGPRGEALLAMDAAGQVTGGPLPITIEGGVVRARGVIFMVLADDGVVHSRARSGYTPIGRIARGTFSFENGAAITVRPTGAITLTTRDGAATELPSHFGPVPTRALPTAALLAALVAGALR